jgi:hypothetical protein
MSQRPLSEAAPTTRLLIPLHLTRANNEIGMSRGEVILVG